MGNSAGIIRNAHRDIVRMAGSVLQETERDAGATIAIMTITAQVESVRVIMERLAFAATGNPGDLEHSEMIAGLVSAKAPVAQMENIVIKINSVAPVIVLMARDMLRGMVLEVLVITATMTTIAAPETAPARRMPKAGVSVKTGNAIEIRLQ